VAGAAAAADAVEQLCRTKMEQTAVGDNTANARPPARLPKLKQELDYRPQLTRTRRRDSVHGCFHKD